VFGQKRGINGENFGKSRPVKPTPEPAAAAGTLADAEQGRAAADHAAKRMPIGEPSGSKTNR
jgi:hypothetical protein